MKAQVLSINLNDKKAACNINNYILFTFLLVTILLLIIPTIPYQCLKHRSERHHHISHIQKESINELKEIGIKNCVCYYFDDIININDLDLSNILLNEKSFEILLIYDVAYKTVCSVKPLLIIFDKVNEIYQKIR